MLFRSFSLDDAPGQVDQLKLIVIKTLIEKNQCYTTQKIADILKISKSSTENHLHQLGYVHHFDVWVPHKLSEKNLLDRFSTCESLLKRKKKFHFFKNKL